MADNKEWLEVLLRKFNEENTVAKVTSLECKRATSKGDNYTSTLNRITMDVVLKSGKTLKKSIIIKELPDSQFSKQFWGNMGLFMKEITVYRDILPYLEDIMIEYADYTEPMWGTCLEYRPYNRLIFDDLSKYGYIMSDRKRGLDMEHCSLVVRSLAKFHATSVILKERGLINMEIFGEHLYRKEKLRTVFYGFHKESFRKLLDAMENSWEPVWKPLAEKIRTKVVPNIIKMLSDLTIVDDNKFNVLCHGDCWVNNMLFKYGIDGVTPVSLKFVDFQVSFYNGPAFDLKYFLLTSPSLDVRKNSIPQLIKLYHESLLKQLELYKYEGNTISLDCLKEELKRIDLFGLIVTMNLLPIIQLQDVESFPEMEEVLKNAVEGHREKTNFNAFEVSSPSVISIIKESVKTFVDNHL